MFQNAPMPSPLDPYKVPPFNVSPAPGIDFRDVVKALLLAQHGRKGGAEVVIAGWSMLEARQWEIVAETNFSSDALRLRLRPSPRPSHSSVNYVSPQYQKEMERYGRDFNAHDAPLDPRTARGMMGVLANLGMTQPAPPPPPELQQPQPEIIVSNPGFMQHFGDALPAVPVPPPITAWSYSRVATHAKCAKKAFYQFVERRKEVESEAIIRGKTIHAIAAAIIERQPVEISADTAELLRPAAALLNELSDRGTDVKCELQQAYTFDWEPVDWFSPRAWLRVVFDVVDRSNMVNKHVRVVEFKTGKLYPEHEEQKSLYAVAAHALYPDAVSVLVEFVYFDNPKHNSQVLYTAEKMPALREKWELKSKPLLSDTTFPVSPGPNCRFCPFRAATGGPCEQGA
jgi:CRISPR/Cas system-associated exonuclease Cas4 (RecB family)